MGPQKIVHSPLSDIPLNTTLILALNTTWTTEGMTTLTTTPKHYPDPALTTTLKTTHNHYPNPSTANFTNHYPYKVT